MSKFITQKPIILASGSKSRKVLLQSLGIKFEVIPSECDEEAIKQSFKGASFNELASTLARTKALAVSQDYPEHTIIAADQLCIIDNTYLDKPGTHNIARQHLQLLRGKTHRQLSACCLAQAGKIKFEFTDEAQLTMRALSDAAIEHYLLQEKPYQSCGAYHFENQGKWLFQDVKGSETTILGLPLIPLAQALLTINTVAL